MYKLCVIGNSHVACLKAALSEEPSLEHDIEYTFFASRGKRIRGLTVEGLSLVASDERLRSALEFTSGGKSAINLDHYDGMLLYSGRSRTPSS